MKLLCDVNVEPQVVSWLVARGHDVQHVRPTQEAATDAELLSAATRQQRILVSRDRHFGELVFRQQQQACGVIYLRLYAERMEDQLASLEASWPVIEAALPGSFVTVLSDEVRTRRLPHQP